jgi:16S rRNA (uracil1498-N3)-methyltransferase
MAKCFCSQLENKKFVTLDSGESHHLISVLRATKGTEIELINGHGILAKGHIENPDKRATQIAIETLKVEIPRFDIRLIQAALTNANTDFVVREACAIGISDICIVQMGRSQSKIKEKNETKLDRFRKILIGACKQSGNLFLPKLSFARSLEDVEISGSDVKIFACPNTSPRYLLEELIFTGRLHSITVAIGPEGGFLENERKFFLQKNFKECKLSDTVLRAETAAIYALSVISNYLYSIC